MSVKNKIERFIKFIKEQVFILYEISKNPDTPLLPKLIVMIALAYALSPIDLIPDFIPVLGYLDDLIILPVLIFIAYKLIPKKIRDDARNKANTHSKPLPDNRMGAFFIILIWILITVYLIYVLSK